MNEDIKAIEGIQKGRNSPAYNEIGRAHVRTPVTS